MLPMCPTASTHPSPRTTAAPDSGAHHRTRMYSVIHKRFAISDSADSGYVFNSLPFMALLRQKINTRDCFLPQQNSCGNLKYCGLSGQVTAWGLSFSLTLDSYLFAYSTNSTTKQSLEHTSSNGGGVGPRWPPNQQLSWPCCAHTVICSLTAVGSRELCSQPMEVCWACAYPYGHAEGTQSLLLHKEMLGSSASCQATLRAVFGRSLGVDIHMSDGDNDTLRT